jgi:hypothetical protein
MSDISSMLSVQAYERLVTFADRSGFPAMISRFPAGSLSANETGSDTFFGVGGGIISGSMAAVESGSDTFAAFGLVTVVGTLAATESGSDTFTASGTTGQAIVFRDPGDWAGENKKRELRYQEEKRAKRRLRKQLANLLDPVSEQKTVDVIAVEGAESAVAVVAGNTSIDIPIPPQFDAAQVAAFVTAQLEQMGVIAYQQQLQAQELAARERLAIEMARRARQRRDEELLLLLD